MSVAQDLFGRELWSHLFFQALLGCQYNYQQGRLGCKLRAGLTCTIFNKSLMLNSATLAAFSSGEVQTFMSVDADRWESCWYMRFRLYILNALKVASPDGVVWFQNLLNVFLHSLILIRLSYSHQMALKYQDLQLEDCCFIAFMVDGEISYEDSYSREEELTMHETWVSQDSLALLSLL